MYLVIRTTNCANDLSSTNPNRFVGKGTNRVLEWGRVRAHTSQRYNASAFVRNHHIHSANLPLRILFNQPSLLLSFLNGFDSPFLRTTIKEC